MNTQANTRPLRRGQHISLHVSLVMLAGTWRSWSWGLYHDTLNDEYLVVHRECVHAVVRRGLYNDPARIALDIYERESQKMERGGEMQIALPFFDRDDYDEMAMGRRPGFWWLYPSTESGPIVP